MREFCDTGPEELHIGPPTSPYSNSQQLVTWPPLASKETGIHSPAAFPGSKREGMERSQLVSAIADY